MADQSERIASIPSSDYLRPVAFRVCLDDADALWEKFQVQARGGEGVMLRHPAIRYKAGRTRQLLKVK